MEQLIIFYPKEWRKILACEQDMTSRYVASSDRLVRAIKFSEMSLRMLLMDG